MPSAAKAAASRRRPEIESSLEGDAWASAAAAAGARPASAKRGRGVTFLTTVTANSTQTSYEFVTTDFTKTLLPSITLS